MSEAGGVHSSTKWENPLSKYGVKSVPWMLSEGTKGPSGKGPLASGRA